MVQLVGVLPHTPRSGGFDSRSWNRLTVVRGEGHGGDWMKEGKEFSQRTYMHDLWTQATVW